MIFRHPTKSSIPRDGSLWAFLVLGMALLILTGEILAQEKKETAGTQQNQKIIPNLFSGLRLKNKTETPQSATVTPASKRQTTEKAAEKATELPVQPDKTQVEPSTVPLPDRVTSAPFPPENNYFEKISNHSGEKRIAPPAETTNFSGPDTTPLIVAEPVQPMSRQTEEPTVASLSSYSFDTRDWVEYFPVDHVPETDSFSSNRTTVPETPVVPPAPPVTAPAAAPVAGSVPQTTPHDWNGTAMPVETAETQSIRLASIKRSFSEISKEAETSKIDLTPSYTSKLKYSEVCGVVVVQSNFPLTEIQTILGEIKLLQRDLNLYMGVPAPKEKIELCLFRDEKTYIKFLHDVFPKAPRDRRALYIKLDGKPGTLLVQKTEEFEVDLRHEMTHAVIHASIRDVPIWLDEGLAKYFEVPIKDRAANNPYMKQIRWNTKFGAVPMLGRLEKLEDIGQMGAREYRDSWAWVHFMIHHSPQTHRLLAGYLQLLAALPERSDSKGRSSVRIPPLSLYLNDELESPRENYREHFQSWQE